MPNLLIKLKEAFESGKIQPSICCLNCQKIHSVVISNDQFTLMINHVKIDVCSFHQAGLVFAFLTVKTHIVMYLTMRNTVDRVDNDYFQSMVYFTCNACGEQVKKPQVTEPCPCGICVNNVRLTLCHLPLRWKNITLRNAGHALFSPASTASK